MSLPNRFIRRLSARTGLNPTELTRFIKFAIVGAIGMVVDLTVLTFSKEILGAAVDTGSGVRVQHRGDQQLHAQSLLDVSRKPQRGPIASQLVQFTVVNLIGLAINEVIVLGLHPIFSGVLNDPFAYLTAKVIAIGVVLFWNYGANRAWTYKGIQ